MAQPETRTGFQVKLELGGPAADDPFAFVCGIDTTELSLERGVIERAIRDCENPFAAPVMKRTPGLKMGSISGSGLLANEFINDIMTAYEAATSYYWRVSVEDGGVWEGAFILSSLSISANADGGSYADISLSLQSDGALTYTPVA